MYTNKSKDVIMKKTLRKTVSFLIIAFLLFGITACNNNVESGTKIYFCANSENVLREENYSGSKEFVLNTFRGDVEGGQIIVNPKNDVAKFNFSVGDLTREGGSEKLSAELIDVFAERYIEVTQSTSGETDTGWYPDALVPIKNYAAKRDNKINKGENQGIWINVNVPNDAVPGTYKGNGTLTLDTETIDVPMTVNIYNIDMPEKNHVKTAFYIDPSSIATGEGKVVDDELMKAYYDFALSKRVSPLTLPDFMQVSVRYNVDDYVEGALKYFQDDKVACFQLPYTANRTDGMVDQSYCEEILTALAEKNVELIEQGENVNFFEKVFFYLGTMIDEPTNDPSAKSNYDNVRICDQRIYQAKVAVADSEILKDHPELQNSVLKVPHIVTTKITDLLYATEERGGVQTWCPLIDKLSSKSARETALERMNSANRRGGEGVWWYTCCNPVNPYPTLHLDDTIMSPRITTWMQYDYKIQGRIYWSMNAWFKRLNNTIVPGFDVWTDALNWENWCNSDGILLYPGSKYGVKGPLATLRLEALRESHEDYEILMLLDNGIQSLSAKHGKNYDSDKILGKFYDRLFNGIFRNDDLTSSKFESVRKELLELTEKVLNDENAATSLLDEYNK